MRNPPPKLLLLVFGLAAASAQPRTVVLHAARLLDVESGQMLAPGEVLVRGDRIVEVGREGRAAGRRRGDRPG